MIYVQPTDPQLVEMGFRDVPALKESFTAISQMLPATSAPSRDGIRYASDTGDVINEALRVGLGMQPSADFNAAAHLVGTRKGYYGYPPQITMDGSRENGYTRSSRLQQRALTTVISDAEVLRLAFAPRLGHAMHVIFKKKGSPLTEQHAEVKSTGKVVLTAGALNTPRLLLLSGVGPAQDLAAYKAKQFIQVPEHSWRPNSEVGKEVQDHVMAMIGLAKDGIKLFDPSGDLELAAAPNRIRLDESRASWLVNKTGPYTQYGPTSMAYLQSNIQEQSGSTQADLQVHTLPHGLEFSKSVRYLRATNVQGPQQGVVMANDFASWGASSWVTYVTLLKTKSKGKIDLNDLSGFHKVSYGNGSMYMSEAEDQARLESGVAKVLQAIQATQNISGVQLRLPLSASAADIKSAVASWETSHLIANAISGTCKLYACLDPNFKVVNTTNVFVADASAFPGQPPVQPVGSVMAMAHWAAGVISKTPTVPGPVGGLLTATLGATPMGGAIWRKDGMS
jgi:choline dehydrogenase-like flavoprotein